MHTIQVVGGISRALLGCFQLCFQVVKVWSHFSKILQAKMSVESIVISELMYQALLTQKSFSTEVAFCCLVGEIQNLNRVKYVWGTFSPP